MAYTVVDILFSLTFFGVWQYYCKEKVSSLFCSVVKSQIVCDICGTFVGPSSTTHSSSIAEHSSTITESNFSRFFRSGISRQTRASKCTTSSYLHLCVTEFKNHQKMSQFDFNLQQRLKSDKRPSGWQCCKMKLIIFIHCVWVAFKKSSHLNLFREDLWLPCTMIWYNFVLDE